MKKKSLLFLIMLFVSGSVLTAQPKSNKFHDLKTLTGPGGTIHLFYRIYSDYGVKNYVSIYQNHIYRYNMQTGVEKLILRDETSSLPLGEISSNTIIDYKFLNNDPEQYIANGAWDEFGFIERHDTTSLFGFLVFPYSLNVGADSMVYVDFGSFTIKSYDGGITWPDPEKLASGHGVADSLILDFPLTAISPYNPNLMFGGGTSGGAFVLSTDEGNTYEIVLEGNHFISDIQFDADSVHMYFADLLNSEECKGESEIPCEYGVLAGQVDGAPVNWVVKKRFDERPHVTVNSMKEGEVYIWNTNTVFVSYDFGESFEPFYTSVDEKISGFAAEGELAFLALNAKLYQIEGGEMNLLKDVYVDTELEHQLPASVFLHQNYPNPFNPATNIEFELAQPSQVTLTVYSVTGQVVYEMIQGRTYPAGVHRVRFDAAERKYLSSGVYFYELKTPTARILKKMTLIK